MTAQIDPQRLHTDFARDGYVAVKPLYSFDEISALNAQIERFIRDVVPQMPDTQVYYEDKADKSTLKQLQRMFEHDSYFNDLMLNGPVRQIAEAVLQEDVVPANMQYFNKPPGVGQATPPHQDGYYFHLTPCTAVTGWLALEDVDEENGCIHYVRGSHKSAAFRPHGQTGTLGFSQGITDFGTGQDEPDSVAFPGGPGTFLMHDASTIHWADANRSATRSRRALGFIYYGASARIDDSAAEAYQSRLDAQLKDDAKL